MKKKTSCLLLVLTLLISLLAGMRQHIICRIGGFRECPVENFQY